MVDLGMVSLFALQFAAVFAVYHVYGRLQAERKDVLAIKEGNKEVTLALNGMDERFKAMGTRIDGVEGAPRAVLLRVQEMEAAIGKTDRELGKMDARVVSINARLSVAARKRNRVEGEADEEEADPASQGVVDEGGTTATPPGSRFIPHNFGAPNRRVG